MADYTDCIRCSALDVDADLHQCAITPASAVTHPKTGLPVEPTPNFNRGDLVTEAFLSDGYPAVVVEATASTVYVQRVTFMLGNVDPADQPGYNGYGDSATLVIDPESVERALAAGRDGAHKYVRRISPKPQRASSFADSERIGEVFHRAKWAVPNSHAGSLQPGARFRQDPHV